MARGRMYVSHYSQKNFATVEELVEYLHKHSFIETPFTLASANRAIYCFKEGLMLYIPQEAVEKLSTVFEVVAGTSIEGRRISEFLPVLEA